MLDRLSMPLDHWLCLVKAILCGLTLFILFTAKWRSKASPRNATVILLGLGFLGALAYFEFGIFHGSSLFPLSHAVYRYPHQSENFHYRLNSKYFDELGYDGLYVASIASQEQTAPQSPVQPFVRDVRTNEIVPTPYLDDHKRAVVARFSPQRWNAFKIDHSYFLEGSHLARLNKARFDHGFNATPTWAFIGKALDFWLPVNQKTIVVLALLDVILLSISVAAVWKTYGLETACLVTLLIGLGYCSDYIWTGGAYLRMDWIAALIIGICCLKLGYFLAGGFLLGYAVMSRLFPILLLFGPVLLIIKHFILHRKPPPWALPFTRGFIFSVLIGLVFGSLAGRGVSAWDEFTDNIIEHKKTWGSNLVGLRPALLSNSEYFSQSWYDSSLPDPWQVVKEKIKQTDEQRKLIIIVATAIFVLMLATASWNTEPDEAVVLSSAAVFMLTELSSYYWILLLILLLRMRNQTLTASILIFINLILFIVHIAYPQNEIRFGVASWAMAVFFVIWLGPNSFRTLRLAFNRTNHSPGSHQLE